LLLVLGVALPRSAGVVSAPESGMTFAYSPPVAVRGIGVIDDREALGHIAHEELLKKGAIASDFQIREDDARVRMDASVQALAAKGDRRESEKLARLYANNLTRQALVFREKGDLVAAEPALHQACQFCTQALGSEAPETIRTRNTLAGIYEVALNTAPATQYSPHFTYSTPVSSSHPTPAWAGNPHPTLSALDVDGAASPYDVESAAPRNPYAASNAYTNAISYPAPVRSASGYEPAASSQRKLPQAAGGRSATIRPMAAMSAKQAMHNGHAPSSTSAVLALRDRITRQTQKELRTSVVPVLVQALRDTKDASERVRLQRALGQLGPAARESVPLLLDCYRRSADHSESIVVLQTLGQIGHAAGQAAPVLVESLQSDNREIRDWAARALLQLGPEASDWSKDLDQKSKTDVPIEHLLRYKHLLRYMNSPAGRSGIEDEAECLSLHTIQLAREEIHQLAASSHFEVRIATVADQAALKVKKEQFDRAASPKGVYLCIDREAADVHIHVSETLQKQGLTEARLRSAVEPYLRKKQLDRGLLAGLGVLAEFGKQQVKQ
jgi:hypothetical protein